MPRNSKKMRTRQTRGMGRKRGQTSHMSRDLCINFFKVIKEPTAQTTAFTPYWITHSRFLLSNLFTGTFLPLRELWGEVRPRTLTVEVRFPAIQTRDQTNNQTGVVDYSAQQSVQLFFVPDPDFRQTTIQDVTVVGTEGTVGASGTTDPYTHSGPILNTVDEFIRHDKCRRFIPVNGALFKATVPITSWTIKDSTASGISAGAVSINKDSWFPLSDLADGTSVALSSILLSSFAMFIMPFQPLPANQTFSQSIHVTLRARCDFRGIRDNLAPTSLATKFLCLPRERQVALLEQEASRSTSQADLQGSDDLQDTDSDDVSISTSSGDLTPRHQSPVR